MAAKLGRGVLKDIKKENGGLQTLLRNHRYVFWVQGGRVGLRVSAVVFAL